MDAFAYAIKTIYTIIKIDLRLSVRFPKFRQLLAETETKTETRFFGRNWPKPKPKPLFRSDLYIYETTCFSHEPFDFEHDIFNNVRKRKQNESIIE